MLNSFPDIPTQGVGQNPEAVIKLQQATQNQMLREYVAGGDLNLLAALRKALPQWIDDVTRDFGNDLYERMGRDADVDSAIDILKFLVLADGFRMVPAVEAPPEDETDPTIIENAKKAEGYAKFHDRRLKDMNPSLRDLAAELLDGLLYGHKVAEKIMVYVESGEDKGKLGWLGVKCRDRHNYAFVVDCNNNVLGFLTVQPGAGIYNLGSQTLLGDPEQYPNYLPRNKFVVFSFETKNGDPRGTSIARSAYQPWFMKTQVMPEYYNYLRRFGSPSIVGYTPPDGMPYVDKVDPATGQTVKDTTGEPVQISAEQAMMGSLLRFLNGTVIAVKGNSKVELIFSQGDGKAFLDAFDYFGRQIHLAILKTERASKEAKHGSKADSGSAQDMLNMLVTYIKACIEDVINNDMIEDSHFRNFGADAMDLCPRVSLSTASKHDKAALISAYATAYAAGMIHDSQLPGIDAECDLPPRDMEQVHADKEEEKANAQLAAGAQQDLYNPAGQPTNPANTPKGPKPHGTTSSD